jgi:serine/threonine protein kinase
MNEETLFQEALSRSPGERAAFLEQACAGRPELLAAVQVLLAAHEKPGNVLDRPPAELGRSVNPAPDQARGPATGEAASEPDAPPLSQLTTTDFRPDALPGAVIAGRYTLVEKIGEGGMGEVWVAKQTEPVKRKVALKLIKAGMDSRAVLQRFDQERQALALMDHPNIARVLDGGLTPTGQPFFVMELVNGLPLTKFCDEARLTPKERLQLFVPICQAVQHAHHKGIVHRDLKPANILVTLIDGRPVPKVIDFGVAKATAGKLTDESLSTQFGAVIGTLEYMAPEQAGFSGVDIDTRADIYSLGVVLYELLTGLRPINARRLRKAGLAEMARLIQEEDPSKPSTRLSTEEGLASLAALRRTEPRKLLALLRGDLDWVVMKCLEKQRDRRYETANGLARDLQRYLADEAVEARPASAGYRLRKFLKRYKGPVVAASLVLLALLVGTLGTTWGLYQALQATAAEKTAHAQSQQRLTQIEKANDLLGSIFENLDPKEIAKAERPLQAILVEKLDRAVAQLEGESIGDPLVVATMQLKFANSLVGLGEPGKAIVLLERARATIQAKLGPEHPDTLNSMNSLAQAYWEARKLDLALPLFAETLKLTKAKLGPEHPLTLTSMNNLASTYQAAGKRDLALPLFAETLKLRKAHLGPEHPDTLATMNNLAGAYHDAGKLGLAVPLLEETLKVRKAKLGPEHPETLISISGLAQAYQDAGRLDLALPLFEETLKLRKSKLGPEHPETLITMGNLAAAYWQEKQLDKSIALFEETLKHQEAKLGRDHPDTVLTVANLGVNYKDAGRFAEAIPLLEEAYRAAKKYPQIRWVGTPLLDAYATAGEDAKFANLIQEQLAEARKTLPKDSPQLASRLAQIGLGLLGQKKWAEAEPLLRECLAIREKKEPDDWRTFNTESMLGGALLGQKKYADAEPLLRAGYQGMKQREKAIPPQGQVRIPEAIQRLVQLYEATDRKDEAAKWRKELEAIKEVEKKP